MIEKILELRNNKVGYKKIAKELGLSPLYVSKALIDNGYIDHINIDIDKQNLIIELYSNGKGMIEISKDLKVSQQSISNVLYLNKISITNKGYHTNYENKINHNYFEKINSEEKAYWLGFLFADGYVNEKTYQIELTLCEKDLDHIEKFNKAIESTYKISKKCIGDFVAYRTNAYSKKLTLDLVKLGCCQNKSLTIKPPNSNQVPDKFIKSFIRGYVDGDGCFSVDKVFSITGTKEILDYIICHLRENTDISKAGNFQMTGNAYQWFHNGKKDYKIIHKYLYENSNVYLTRKYNKCRHETTTIEGS